MWRRTSMSVERLAKALQQVNRFDLVAFMTAYMLIRISHSPISLSVALISTALMLSKRIRTSPWFWFAIVGSWLPELVVNWHRHEDHIFFGVYWCAAIGLAAWGGQKKITLRKSARLAVGLCFTFAIIWKIITPQFYQGELFQFKLIYDYRFAQMVTTPIAGMPVAAIEGNVQSYRALRAPENDLMEVDIDMPQRVLSMAALMTVWTIFIEGLMAALFLTPATALTNRWRDWSLIVFMVTTYFVVPVMGFASIFCAMGLAQCPADRHKTKLAYVAIGVVLFGWYSIRLNF